MSNQTWAEWHAGHERNLADPHGFLAITSLNFLDATPRHFPDAPGEWSTGPDGVTVELADGESLTVDGAEVTGRHNFGVLPERGGVFPGFGDAVVEVAKRGGFDIIRPRHPSNELRLQFHGVPAYEPTEKWELTGRYVPFDEPRDVTVGAAVEGLEHVYESPGRVDFEAPTARSRSTSTVPPTWSAPTRTSPPAHCPRRRTGCRSRSKRARRSRTSVNRDRRARHRRAIAPPLQTSVRQLNSGS